MSHASTRPFRSDRAGFTMSELLVVIVLGALIILALQVSLVRQRQLYEVQGAISDRHETLRFGVAVFGAAMRESVLADGDVDILAPNRVQVRVPHGFGVVCGTDNNGGRVGVVALQGSWTANDAGDSLWIQRAGVSTADLIGRIDPADPRVACTLLAGGIVVRPDVRAPDADIGVPARSFRSQLFESATQNGKVWLFRQDGLQRELLLGPLDPVDGFRVQFEDAAGVPVADPAVADHVSVRLIAISTDVRGQPLARRDTVTLELGRRNR